jgi:uncharacterized protein with HEPN domain
MNERDRLTLEQLLATAVRLRTLAHTRDRAALDRDDVALLAMLHLIQRLGESASRLTADFRAAHPEFPWHEMIGMRNRIVHADADLDPDIVWRIATADIETVIAATERAMTELG